jgi:hypothetical protein
VVATDYFGQTARGSGAFAIDTSGPATRFTKKPKNKGFKRKARFRFTSEPAAAFLCALDRKAFKPCTSPFKKRVKPGRHKFRVLAVDALGNEGSVVRDRWRVRKR